MSVTSGMAVQAVAMLVENLGGGGAERVTVTLANALARRGVAVDLVMQEARGPYLRDVHADVRQIDIAGSGARGALATIKFLASYLRERRPAIFFTHMEKPSLLALVAGMIAGYRTIVPVMHTDLIMYSRLEHRLRRTLLMWLVQLLYKFSNSVVAVSEGAGRSMRILLGAKPPVHVVRNGFDFEALRHAAAAMPEHPWLADKTLPVIVSCGRMVPLKGYDILLRAFALLRRAMPARLLILGEGPLRESLTALAAELKIENDVAMPGFLPNPAACFARADVVVLASRVEGLSNVLLEALAVGAPVISTDCPTGPREILQGGKFGGLVPVDDVPALAKAMEAGLRHPETLRNSGLENHLRAYAVDAMVAGYARLIEEARETT